jgi:hypothetical protein
MPGYLFQVSIMSLVSYERESTYFVIEGSHSTTKALLRCLTSLAVGVHTSHAIVRSWRAEVGVGDRVGGAAIVVSFLLIAAISRQDCRGPKREHAESHIFEAELHVGSELRILQVSVNRKVVKICRLAEARQCKML